MLALSTPADGTGWLVLLCTVGGLLLVAAAFALHRGCYKTQLNEEVST